MIADHQWGFPKTIKIDRNENALMLFSSGHTHTRAHDHSQAVCCNKSNERKKKTHTQRTTSIWLRAKPKYIYTPGIKRLFNTTKKSSWNLSHFNIYSSKLHNTLVRHTKTQAGTHTSMSIRKGLRRKRLYTHTNYNAFKWILRTKSRRYMDGLCDRERLNRRSKENKSEKN